MKILENAKFVSKIISLLVLKILLFAMIKTPLRKFYRTLTKQIIV